MVTKKRTYQLSLSECRGKPVLRRILPNALLNPRSGSTPTSNPFTATSVQDYKSP